MKLNLPWRVETDIVDNQFVGKFEEHRIKDSIGWMEIDFANKTLADEIVRRVNGYEELENQLKSKNTQLEAVIYTSNIKDKANEQLGRMVRELKEENKAVEEVNERILIANSNLEAQIRELVEIIESIQIGLETQAHDITNWSKKIKEVLEKNKGEGSND